MNALDNLDIIEKLDFCMFNARLLDYNGTKYRFVVCIPKTYREKIGGWTEMKIGYSTLYNQKYKAWIDMIYTDKMQIEILDVFGCTIYSLDI